MQEEGLPHVLYRQTQCLSFKFQPLTQLAFVDIICMSEVRVGTVAAVRSSESQNLWTQSNNTVPNINKSSTISSYPLQDGDRDICMHRN